MLDKNPENVFYNLQEILNKFSKKNPNIIVCSQPFTKSQFLNELIDSIDFPIIYLDFDLLFSGYVISKMIPKNDKVEIHQLGITNEDEIKAAELDVNLELRKFLQQDKLKGVDLSSPPLMRVSLLKSLPRAWSVAPFLRLIVDQCE